MPTQQFGVTRHASTHGEEKEGRRHLPQGRSAGRPRRTQ
jgi:hypothetical protein